MPKAERVESINIVVTLTLQEAHELKAELNVTDKELGGLYAKGFTVMDAVLEQLGHFALPDRA